MSKVSILIAAYNVEEFIAGTLDSVVNQTLKDIEIIIVDDSSTDSTPEIISKYASLDSRIRIVRHEANGGLVRVRQTGLKNATGEYIMFLDGDDALTLDACEKAYNAIVSENVDMLQFDVGILFSFDLRPSKTVVQDQKDARYSVRHKVVSDSKAGVLDEKAVGDIINYTIWDKIYKKELLVKAAKYVPDEYLNMAEDVLYSFIIQYHAPSFSYIPDELYLYRYGSGMSTTKKMTERIMKSIAKNAYVYSYLNNFLVEMDAKDEGASALQRVHKQLYTHIVNAYLSCKNTEERHLLLSEVLKYGSADVLLFTLSDYFYDELEGYKTSESYRIGMIITYIPRKVIAFIKRLFCRKPD